MSDAAPEDDSEPFHLHSPTALTSRDRFECSRSLKVGLPNGGWSELGSLVDGPYLLLVYQAESCPDRMAAEIAWVDERLVPDVPFIVVGDAKTIRTGLAQLSHCRARTYQDVSGAIAQELSPTAPRTAYLVDPINHRMIGVTSKDHLFDLGRAIRDTDERGNDRVLDLGDVFR